MSVGRHTKLLVAVGGSRVDTTLDLSLVGDYGITTLLARAVDV